MIKAVLFDFVQTLVDASQGFKVAEKDAQNDIFQDICLTNWDKFLFVYRRIRKEFHRRGIYGRKEFWENIYLYYGCEPDKYFLKELEDQYWEIVKRERKPFPEVVGVLQKLSKLYRLGIVTNSPRQGRKNTYPIREHSDIECFFEVVIVADMDSIPAKPSPEPFLLCVRKLGVTPEESVYVGDDWYTDITGAINAGIKPIWVQHNTVKRSWPVVETDVPVINSLEELLNLEGLLGKKDSKVYFFTHSK